VTNRRKVKSKNKTKTHFFVLPMCGINPKLLPHNYINSYIYDTNNKTIVLCFDIVNIDDLNFNKFLEVIDNNECYTCREEDAYEILLHFKIPEKHYDDFNNFLKGKYNNLNENYKNTLLSIYGRASNTQTYEVNMVNALYPQAFKRKQIAERLAVDINIIPEDVLDVPDLDVELYTSIFNMITI